MKKGSLGTSSFIDKVVKYQTSSQSIIAREEKRKKLQRSCKICGVEKKQWCIDQITKEVQRGWVHPSR